MRGKQYRNVGAGHKIGSQEPSTNYSLNKKTGFNNTS